MQAVILPGYEGGQAIGQRKFWVFTAKGPTSYANPGGDALSFASYEYLDYVAPTMTVSKTYEVRFFPSVAGTRPTWTAKWYTVAGAEVGNATNLSAESIQTFMIGGEF